MRGTEATLVWTPRVCPFRSLFLGLLRSKTHEQDAEQCACRELRDNVSASCRTPSPRRASEAALAADRYANRPSSIVVAGLEHCAVWAADDQGSGHLLSVRLHSRPNRPDRDDRRLERAGASEPA